MKNFAWINTDNNLVENVIYYDGESTITLPENVQIIEMPDDYHGTWSPLGIGWSYINGQFVEPPEPEQLARTAGSQTP
jgi:hypothetical protein